MKRNEKKGAQKDYFIEKADMKKTTGNDEVLEWYRLTPAERFTESQKLWETFILLGGSYDEGADTQSPFDIFKT